MIPGFAVRAMLLVAAVTLVGCVDFGYGVYVPPEVDSGGGGGGGGGTGDCVEGPATPSDSGPQVSIITLNVDTPVLVITVGETVTWTNTDSDTHTVTAGAPGVEIPEASGGFNSGDLGTGAKFAYRFCSARTAVYFCKTHPQQMNGYQVIVEE